MTEQDNQTPKSEQLKQTVAELRNTLKNNELCGTIHNHIGLPDDGSIVLADSDPDFHHGLLRKHIRIYRQDNGSLSVCKMSPSDYGMGMDTMWFEWQELIVSTDGKVRQLSKSYPHNPPRSFATLPNGGVLAEKRAERVIRTLQNVVNNAVRLKQAGKLKEAVIAEDVRERRHVHLHQIDECDRDDITAVQPFS